MTHQRTPLLLYSIAPDRIPQDAPEDHWTDANNVLFKNGETVRIPPDRTTLDGATHPARTAIYTISSKGARYWVYASEAGIWAHDGTTETEITPDSGWTSAYAPNENWTSCSMGGIVYFNGSERDPVYWAGDTSKKAEVLPDWPSGGRVNALRAHKNFLFAIGALDGNFIGQRLNWSDAAEPGTVPQHWSPAADNLAGFVDFTAEAAPLLGGETLRDNFLLYKSEGVYQATFVGGNDVFAFRKLFSEHGIAGVNAVTTGIDDVHVFAGDDGDMYMTDGVEVISILDQKAQRKYYSEFEANERRTFVSLTLAREKLALMCYQGFGAKEGTCNRAVIFNFIDRSISFRDVADVTCGSEGSQIFPTSSQGGDWDSDNDSWDSDDTIWNSFIEELSVDDAVVGALDGFHLLTNVSGADEAGKEITARVERYGLALGNAEIRQDIVRCWPKVVGAPGDVLHFQFGFQEIAGGPFSLTQVIDFTIGQQRHIDFMAQGRYFAVFVSSKGGSAWRLGSMDFEVRAAGEW